MFQPHGVVRKCVHTGVLLGVGLAMVLAGCVTTEGGDAPGIDYVPSPEPPNVVEPPVIPEPENEVGEDEDTPSPDELGPIGSEPES